MSDPAMGESLSVGIVCYPSLGGSGVVAAELANGLAARGHAVHVIASAPPGRALADAANLRFHRVAVPDHPVFEHPPYELAVAGTIVEVAAAHHLDLVHVHYAVPHAASAHLARQTLGAAAPRLVVTLHGSDVTGIGIDPRYRAVNRFAIAAAEAVTVPSAWLRDEARRLLELDAVEVVPNFVDTATFTPPRSSLSQRSHFDGLFPAGGERGPVLFHVSNFRPVKRPGDLIEVLARVRRALPARLVLVGDGPERAATASRAAELGVAEHVAFAGPLPAAAELLRSADAFLLTSESESFGVAALEALSSGVPVFAYRVGGLPDVVADGTGALVEPFDVAALADAVLAALREPGRRAALGRAARTHVLHHFQADAAVQRYEACYRRVMESHSR